MDIIVAAVGKLGRGPEADLAAAYAKRLAWPVRVVECPESRADTVDQRRADEARRLRKALDRADRLIALDERGTALTSRDLARQIKTWQDDGCRHLGLIVGGPDGLAPDLTRSAALTLSLGRLTWPHKLARAMVYEQLYRAWTITQGHPYHRD